jgi:hypothetical protein
MDENSSSQSRWEDFPVRFMTFSCLLFAFSSDVPSAVAQGNWQGVGIGVCAAILIYGIALIFTSICMPAVVVLPIVGLVGIFLKLPQPAAFAFATGCVLLAFVIARAVPARHLPLPDWA